MNVRNHSAAASHLDRDVEQQTVRFVLDLQKALRIEQRETLLQKKTKTQENRTTHHHYPAETRLIGLYQAENIK